MVKDLGFPSHGRGGRGSGVSLDFFGGGFAGVGFKLWGLRCRRSPGLFKCNKPPFPKQLILTQIERALNGTTLDLYSTLSSDLVPV